VPLLVAVNTLIKTAYDSSFYKIYILADDMSDEHQRELGAYVNQSRHCLEFINIKELLSKHDLPFSISLPMSAWSRIFIPDLLKNESGLVLYCDIDVIFCRDLKELFFTNLQGKAIGAVLENYSAESPNVNKRLGMPMSCSGYFNSGVLLMDLDKFRLQGLVELVLQHATKYRAVLSAPDQDALNAALCENMIPLHPKWNWDDGHTKKLPRGRHGTARRHGITLAEAVEALLHPGIIHYVGPHKPWFYNYRCEGPRYEAAMRDIGYAVAPLPKRTWKKVCKKYLYKPFYWAIERRLLHLEKQFRRG
jgi:lipopolysaccharide biosynthesis glycosyltransferase